MTPPPSAGEYQELVKQVFALLCRKYVQRSDARQKEMGLQYTEAETHDLAELIAKFTADTIRTLIARAIHKSRQECGLSGEAAWEYEPPNIHDLYRHSAQAALLVMQERMADHIAKAIQEARDMIGASEQQRIAFAYAEAAMRSALANTPTA